MSAAEIKETKTNLIAWIEQMSDENMLSMLEGVKEMSFGDTWSELTPAQIDHIEAGVKEADSGNLMSSEEFWKKLKNA